MGLQSNRSLCKLIYVKWRIDHYKESAFSIFYSFVSMEIHHLDLEA